MDILLYSNSVWINHVGVAYWFMIFDPVSENLVESALYRKLSTLPQQLAMVLHRERERDWCLLLCRDELFLVSSMVPRHPNDWEQ